MLVKLTMWSWQYYYQTIWESLKELFVTYFVLDLLDLIRNVSNNLYEKFDETLVVMASLIYRQQPSLFPWFRKVHHISVPTLDALFPYNFLQDLWSLFEQHLVALTEFQ